MSGVLFSEGNKKILFNIKDYQFSYSKNMDFYDVNWLTIEIRYYDKVLQTAFTDSCLLTYELEDLLEQIDSIIDGKESGMISDFMEPYLKFSITKIEEVYAVQVRFVYDTSGSWKDIYISQGMNMTELVQMRAELGELYKKFPVRKVKK